MVFDFSFVLVALALITGLVWGVDHWLFAPRRAARGNAKEPLLVDYSRSFFPVIVIVHCSARFSTSHSGSLRIR